MLPPAAGSAILSSCKKQSFPSASVAQARSGRHFIGEQRDICIGPALGNCGWWLHSPAAAVVSLAVTGVIGYG
jgi:hypothetical protein